MSLTLKFGDEIEPEETGEDKPDIVNYETDGNVRNVCFVQPDGKSLFLNYAYLVSAEFIPANDTITLGFTTHTAILKGNNLDGLYDDLMKHRPMRIACIEERYLATKGDNEIIVTNITIQ